MTNSLSINKRLALSIIMPAIVAALLLGIFAYQRSQQALMEGAERLLLAVQNSRSHEVGSLFADVARDLHITAERNLVIDALTKFEGEWAALGPEPAATLVPLYVEGQSGEDHGLGMDSAGDESGYSSAHAIYHPILRDLMQRNGYDNLFFLDHEGNVLYSVAKGRDFASNVLTGPWQQTGLGRCYRDVADHFQSSYTAFCDYEAYEPFGGAPAAFMAAPIFDHEGKKHGTLVLQLPSDRIAEILGDSTGLGRTGESFLVGEDLLMHSNSRLSASPTILRKRVDTQTVRAALAGGKGIQKTTNHMASTVLSAYGQLEVHGRRIAVISEIGLKEVQAPAHSLLLTSLLGLLVLAVAVGLLGMRVSRGLTDPIVNLIEATSALAEGRTDTEVPATDRRDELGQMARAVEVFKQYGLEIKRLEQEQRRQEEREEQERLRVRLKLADDFEASVGQVVQAVSAAAAQLQVTAQSMSTLSERTSSQAGSVAAAAEESSVNLGAVAAASEELAGSIHEINRQIQISSKIAGRAVARGQDADNTMAQLTRSMARIGEVVDLINGVADQTNLLALNATIEAARAGDAGKGFAVVADEVKTLAGQTKHATEEIREQIMKIKHDAELAAVGIREIGHVIGENEEVTTSIAGAMEEQGATTQEIARNVDQAAAGTKDVSASIAMLTTAAGETGAASGQVLASAQELGRSATQLTREMRAFLQKIREA